MGGMNVKPRLAMSTLVLNAVLLLVGCAASDDASEDALDPVTPEVTLDMNGDTDGDANGDANGEAMPPESETGETIPEVPEADANLSDGGEASATSAASTMNDGQALSSGAATSNASARIEPSYRGSPNCKPTGKTASLKVMT